MNGSLYLQPSDPHQAPAVAPLLELLRELEIIAAPLAAEPRKQTFRAGPGFARQVIFAGCSPHLRFDPAAPEDRDFCHVALIGPLDAPLLLTGGQTAKPRCPACRARIAGWRDRITDARTPVECPACGRRTQACRLDWRQQAAAGRVLIELRNVFPGEAEPADRLVQDLARTSGIEWRHAWAGMSPLP